MQVIKEMINLSYLYAQKITL